MSTPRIIGLTGLEGAGKDTVAGILQQHLHTDTVAFADALRYEVCRAFGCELQTLTCRTSKEQPVLELALDFCSDTAFALALASAGIDPWKTGANSPRQIMRWWGTEYRRAQNPDYWVEKMRERLGWASGVNLPTHTIVITDVRFANEAALVRELGGQIWRIHRPGHNVQAGHISTTTGAEFAPDQTVINAGDIADLERAVLQHWSHAPLYWR